MVAFFTFSKTWTDTISLVRIQFVVFSIHNTDCPKSDDNGNRLCPLIIVVYAYKALDMKFVTFSNVMTSVSYVQNVK